MYSHVSTIQHKPSLHLVSYNMWTIGLVAQVFITLQFAVLVCSCPSGCSCSEAQRRLTVTCSGIDDVPRLDIPNNTNILRISGTNLRGLNKTFLDGLDKLQVLSLEKCGINYIEPGAFSSSPHLEEISMQYNPIERLEPYTFAGLFLLKHLNLYENNIKHLSYGTFSMLVNLETLDLNNNLIKFLPSGLFSPLSKLKYMQIGFNQVEVLTPYNFIGLHSLLELYLYQNKISKISSLSFAGLINLQKLHLSSNNIRNIPHGTFKDLFRTTSERRDTCHIRYLVLSDNSLATIYPGMLEDIGLSTTFDGSLYLSGNNIRKLPEGVFSNYSKLCGLRLHENQLGNLLPGVFEGLKMLQTLSLGDLGMTHINGELFKDVSLNQGSLHLDRNKLTDMEHVFQLINTYLGGLQYLNLESIGLKTVPKLNLPYLEHLDLRNNHIEIFHVSVVKQSVKLRYLSLENNLIKTLPVNMDAFLRNNDNGKGVQVDLRQNPFHCNCEMKWLKQLHLDRHSLVRYYEPSCQTPYSKPLSKTYLHDFKCQQPSLITVSIGDVNGNNSTTSLTCSMRGDPAPNIVIANDKKQTWTFSPRDTASGYNNASIVLTEKIETGYTCSGSNYLGTFHASMYYVPAANATV